MTALDLAAPARAAVLGKLKRIVGAQHVLEDTDLVEPFRRDMQPLAEAGHPLAVVRPRTTREVAEVVKACAAAHVPVVPRGAGSGMTGAANAVDGAVTILLTRMTDLEIDTDSGMASVQAGVVTLDLKNAARGEGLFYAPDPTSADWCTIGGNLANGSAGPCGSKYGVTGDAVRGLTVVLANGEVLETGRATLKGVAGYDLNRLFVGSEGTLGIITEARLALSPAPPAPRTAIATFDDLHRAIEAVGSFGRSGQRLSLLEILDGRLAGVVESYLDAPLDDSGTHPEAVLLAQSDTADGSVLSAFTSACEQAGAVQAFGTDDAPEGEMLMAYWLSVEAALEARGQWILHEATVPPPRVGTLIEEIHRAADARGIFVGVHGHVADGTVHPMIVMDPDRPGQLEAARQVYGDILDIARALGGTLTGEHGVGRMKCAGLAAELGDAGTAVHRAIKNALDPAGLLNPGCMDPARTGADLPAHPPTGNDDMERSLA